MEKTGNGRADRATYKAGTAEVDHSSARVRDVLKDPKALWRLLKDSVSAWIDDFAPSMGAAISYYTVFSIAPLLLIVIAIAGLVLGQDAASGQIFAQLQGLLGDEGAAAIEGMVKSASLSGKSFFATAVGVVTLIIGATTVFAELQSALDRIWESPAAEKKEGIWNLVRTLVRHDPRDRLPAADFARRKRRVVGARVLVGADVWRLGDPAADRQLRHQPHRRHGVVRADLQVPSAREDRVA